MADEIMKLSDMVEVPQKFGEYISLASTELSAFVRSGAVGKNNIIRDLITGANPKGGTILEIPFVKPLAGDDQVFGEYAIETSGFETGSMNTPLLLRQRGWGQTDLSIVIGGKSFMDGLLQMVVEWWVRQEQKIALSVLEGVFKNALIEHVHDISGSTGTDSIIQADSLRDTIALLGDANGQIATLIAHSATVTALRKQGKINEDVVASTVPGFVNVNKPIKRFDGIEIIEDDSMPFDNATGVYTTYILGQNSIQREEGIPTGLVPAEVYRKPDMAETYFYSRKGLVFAPTAINYVKPTAYTNPLHKTPANVDLALGSAWTLAGGNHKLAPMLALKHKV